MKQVAIQVKYYLTKPYIVRTIEKQAQIPILNRTTQKGLATI